MEDDGFVTVYPHIVENIIQFQAGREAAIAKQKRDARRSKDWLAGYDQEAG